MSSFTGQKLLVLFGASVASIVFLLAVVLNFKAVFMYIFIRLFHLKSYEIFPPLKFQFTNESSIHAGFVSLSSNQLNNSHHLSIPYDNIKYSSLFMGDNSDHCEIFYISENSMFLCKDSQYCECNSAFQQIGNFIEIDTSHEFVTQFHIYCYLMKVSKESVSNELALGIMMHIVEPLSAILHMKVRSLTIESSVLEEYHNIENLSIDFLNELVANETMISLSENPMDTINNRNHLIVIIYDETIDIDNSDMILTKYSNINTVIISMNKSVVTDNEVVLNTTIDQKEYRVLGYIDGICRQIRNTLRLSSISSRFHEFDGLRAPVNDEFDFCFDRVDIQLLQMKWINQLMYQCYTKLTLIDTDLLHHTVPTSLVYDYIKITREYRYLFGEYQSSLDKQIVAYHIYPRLRLLYDDISSLANSEYFGVSTDFPWEQRLAIFAPFWLPLIVPFIKGIQMIRNHR